MRGSQRSGRLHVPSGIRRISTQVSVSLLSFLVSVTENRGGSAGAFKGSAPLPLIHFLLGTVRHTGN